MFDGMSCGMIAMQNAGLKVKSYTAYEIDKYAIKTSLHNFPNIVQCGNVFDADFTQYKGVDFLIGGSPCFVAGTMIKTANGFKPIEQVVVGDYVLTHKGRYKKVKEVMKRLVGSTVIVRAENCGKIECTDEHPFYTKNVSRVFNNSKRCYERISDNNFAWKNPKQFETVRNSSKTIMKQTYLSAVTDSGKSLPKYYGADIKVNQFEPKRVRNLDLGDKNIWYIIGRWLGDGWFNYKYRKGKHLSGIKICCGKSEVEELRQKLDMAGLQYYKSEERTVVKFVISSVELAEYLKAFGEGAANKHIPEDVFELPDDLAVSFLDGYFDADGHIENGIGSFATVSEYLAYGIKYMINKYYKMPCTIIKKRNHSDSIEGRNLTVRDIYTGTFRNKACKQSHHIIDGNYILAPYKSVLKHDGERMVYNLSVEDDESYTANGLVVHNCTHWSIAQKKNRETEASGVGWNLFQQYVRALREAKPKFFIYENNKSMSKAIKASITETFGFEPVLINSALVSAQNRQRLYWVGKQNADGTYSRVNVEQPKDRGILLRDILEDGVAEKDKGYCLKHQAGNARDYFKKHHTNIKFEPVNTTADGKSQTLKAQYKNTNQQNICCYKSTYGASGVAEPVNFEPVNTTVDGKAQAVQATCYKDGIRNMIGNNVDRRTCAAAPIRVGELGNGGQGNRIYSVDGKAVAQCGQSGGLDSNTGLYAMCVAQRGRYNSDGTITQMYEVREGGKTNAVTKVQKDNNVVELVENDKNNAKIYEVKNGYIKIKDKDYPIKLPDGFYIIRKLTVRECMRLQTVPEWYDFSCVSDSQSYKMLGNGWTCDVITHLINSILTEE